MRRLTGSGMCALVALAVLAPGSASAAKADAKVIINQYVPPPIVGIWYGQVKSDRKACKAERIVTLYRKEGDEKVEVAWAATYQSGNKWEWSFTADDIPGKYVAVADETERCNKAKSTVFDYPEDNPPPRAVR